MNIPAINHEQLTQIIKLHYERKLPLFIWGTFGIGKSYMVRRAGREIAEKLGLKYSEDVNTLNDPDYFTVIVIPLHQYDVAEIKGLPFPDKKTGTTKYFTTNMLPRNKKAKGIIFFDELNLAPPLIQSNAYQLILDRRLGEYSLPDGYLVIGAGNTEQDKAHTVEFAEPLKNRFAGHYLLKVPSADEWVKNFAVKNGIDERVIAFVSFRDDFMHTYREDNDSTEHIAVATPRTWEFVSEKIKGLEDEELLYLLIGSAVGTEIATEFISFLKLQRNYDIAEIFKDPDKFKAPTEINEIYAFLSASISYYTKNKDKKGMAEKMLKIIMKFKAEHVAWTVMLAQERDPDFIEKISNTKLFQKFADKYLKYFAEIH